MTDRFQNVFALLARVLLAALFLPAGISKIGGFAGTAAYIASAGLPLPRPSDPQPSCTPCSRPRIDVEPTPCP